MSDPTNVPILDIEMFKGITYNLSFLAKDKTNGVVTGPRDLTGKEIAVIFTTIFGDDVTLLSSEPENDFGSVCQVNVDPTTGLFLFSLSGTQLSQLAARDGKWRIEERVGQDAILFLTGAVKVNTFTVGGGL